jgi:hypothetical protein
LVKPSPQGGRFQKMLITTDVYLSLRILIHRVVRIQCYVGIGFPTVRANPVIYPVAHEFSIAPQAGPLRFFSSSTFSHCYFPAKHFQVDVCCYTIFKDKNLPKKLLFYQVILNITLFQGVSSIKGRPFFLLLATTPTSFGIKINIIYFKHETCQIAQKS